MSRLVVYSLFVLTSQCRPNVGSNGSTTNISLLWHQHHGEVSRPWHGRIGGNTTAYSGSNSRGVPLLGPTRPVRCSTIAASLAAVQRARSASRRRSTTWTRWTARCSAECRPTSFADRCAATPPPVRPPHVSPSPRHPGRAKYGSNERSV